MSGTAALMNSQLSSFGFYGWLGGREGEELVEERATRPRTKPPSSAPIQVMPHVNLCTASPVQTDLAERSSTPLEEAIGEIRSWVLMDAGWDGEGALKPSVASIRDAVSFARMLKDDEASLPVPMLLASGHVSLFWNSPTLYADLEFLGNLKLVYFIKRDGAKYKGVVEFSQNALPDLFAHLLKS